MKCQAKLLFLSLAESCFSHSNCFYISMSMHNTFLVSLIFPSCSHFNGTIDLLFIFNIIRDSKYKEGQGVMDSEMSSSQATVFLSFWGSFRYNSGNKEIHSSKLCIYTGVRIYLVVTFVVYKSR